ncbi:MAG: hemin uptake protein HemP [Hyphomicrobiaceae bacterium]
MSTGQAMTDDGARTRHGAGGAGEAAALARVPLDDILKGAKEIIIVHNGDDYRLRVTQRGKLILTK